MKILDSSKSLSVLVSDSTNGLGTIQPLECTVTEELNGIYECEFTVLTTDKHYEDLKNSGLIKVTVGDGSEQIFRVYFISEPINFVVQVKAQHITYDLSKIVVKPFSATGAVNIKNQLVSHILGSYPFTTWTDISNTTSTFTLDIPRSFRECLGGYEGSVLDVLRCEYEWDNLTVKLHARRGADNGVRIAYGKNLTDFVQEQNNENVYDGVYGYAVVDEVTYEASGIYNKTGATTPRVLNVDFSDKYESGDVPTAAELLAYATTYATNNDIEVPNVNIKIDFVPLWQTEEYKDILQLERVSLGDTVHVFFDKLNVEASSRVIKTVWNVLTNKYDSIELGDARANMNTVINETVKETVDNMDIDLDVDVGWLEDKLDTVTNLIANGLGLHITQDSQGRIILHNAETISASQYQYMITAQGFLLSEDYGQTWSSGWTTSGDAVMNSLSTITLNALEIYGSYIYGTQVQGSQIIFGDPNDTSGKYIIAQQYDADSDTNYDGVSFDGTGYVRFQPQEQFIVNNLDGSSNLLNEFVMGSSGTENQAFVTLKNYDYTNHQLANAINMDSHLYNTNTQTYYNETSWQNYETTTGSSAMSNTIRLVARASQNLIQQTNYVMGNGSTIANRLEMFSQSDRNAFSIANYGMSGNYAIQCNSFSAAVIPSASQNTIAMSNSKYASTSPANSISLIGTPMGGGATNMMYLNNYDVDGNNIANQIYMSKSTNDNTLRLRTYRGGNRVAEINMNRASDGTVSITIATISNSTYGYSGATISLNSNGQILLNGLSLSFSGGYVRYS